MSDIFYKTEDSNEFNEGPSTFSSSTPLNGGIVDFSLYDDDDKETIQDFHHHIRLIDESLSQFDQGSTPSNDNNNVRPLPRPILVSTPSSTSSSSLDSYGFDGGNQLKYPSKNRMNATPSSSLNKNKSLSSGNLCYNHVQSKVKAYIQSVKELPRPKTKSLSMSNLAAGGAAAIKPSSNNNLKSFLSSANLNEMTVTLNKVISNTNPTKSKEFDNSRLSRLLDNISDDEVDDDVDDVDVNNDDENVEEIVIDVEEIFQLALEERRDKREAKKVLSQLQSNYDLLQRKYAEAENTIDKLRFETSMGKGKRKETEEQGSFWKKEMSRNTKGVLLDIQDQLYGLELIADNLSITEYESAIDEIKEAFHNLIVDSDRQKGINVMDESQMDPEVIQLLKQIGKKLYLKELKTMDPIEKVSHWKTQFHPPTDGIDLDSGCPGSDRVVEKVESSSSIVEDEDEEDEEDKRTVDHPISSDEFEVEKKSWNPISAHPPVVLAKQIDREINELRSFFEDHRDEMMTLIQQKSNDEDRQQPRRSLSSRHFAASSASSASPHHRYYSQSQSLRNNGHTGLRQDLRKKLLEDDYFDRRIPDEDRRRRKVWTKRKQSNYYDDDDDDEAEDRDDDDVDVGVGVDDDDDYENNENDGKRISTTSGGGGYVFIPRLDMEDLWTESSHGKRRGKKKASREMKDLLKSLEQANKMATKIKERSEEMLTVLRSEISNSTNDILIPEK